MTAVEELREPSFPPLLSGEEVNPGQDPFHKACASASIGVDPGKLTWSRRADAMDAALVLSPEQPLDEAIGVVFALANGMADAVGALAPPEVAVHFDWPGGFRLNGAHCGAMRAMAATSDPRSVPEWLVIGAQIAYLPALEEAGGENPDQTSLIEEGCGDVTPLRLLESWSRHSLVWINTFLDRGFLPLHSTWCGRAWQMGEPLSDGSGTFMGLDEQGGMLLRSGEKTSLRPLTEILE